ncbi:dihydrofolate reductase [Tomitella cavernea]|uniref:Dihydrofolate reductase n=1 Tax=Tomitella cavernea TaxID=1387982 RepID=A0ABP9CMX3_9ACTN|nr:dihydrofolate reductase [Tomitella cavernea]
MLGMIWAQTRGGVIGAGGTMPWHLPEDLAHFKAVTAGHPVIMGRATWDSLPPRFRPLPGRRNIVVTRDLGWWADGATAVHSTSEALVQARSSASPEAWVTGGAQIYSALLPHADLCAVTDIDVDVAGDTLAPLLDAQWVDVAPAEWQVSARSGLRYRFRTLRRQAPGDAAAGASFPDADPPDAE